MSAHVEIQYLSEATPDYLFPSLNLVQHIHQNMDPGDILLFLASVNKIEQACSQLRDNTHDLDVLPLYVALSESEEKKFVKASPL